MNNDDVAELTLARFEASSIDAERFDHEAHIYVGWLYLEACPVTEAITRFTAALRRLTDRLGVPGKYHDTITWFFMLLIAERRIAGEDWSSFRNNNPDLFDRSDNILSRYYTPATLASDKARESFVLPDALAA